MVSDQAAAALDAVYAEIPDAGCKGLCVDSCGSVGMATVERDRIAADRGMVLPLAAAFGAGHCPALRNGQCSVYEVRPTVCRLWGAVERLPCEHGCVPEGGRLPDREGTRIMSIVEVISRRATLGKYA